MKIFNNLIGYIDCNNIFRDDLEPELFRTPLVRPKSGPVRTKFPSRKFFKILQIPYLQSEFLKNQLKTGHPRNIMPIRKLGRSKFFLYKHRYFIVIFAHFDII